MSSEFIRKLENYNTRMHIIISELERLDCEDDFLEDISKVYGDIVRKCESKREKIQRKRG